MADFKPQQSVFQATPGLASHRSSALIELSFWRFVTAPVRRRQVSSARLHLVGAFLHRFAASQSDSGDTLTSLKRLLILARMSHRLSHQLCHSPISTRQCRWGAAEIHFDSLTLPRRWPEPTQRASRSAPRHYAIQRFSSWELIAFLVSQPTCPKRSCCPIKGELPWAYPRSQSQVCLFPTWPCWMDAAQSPYALLLAATTQTLVQILLNLLSFPPPE